MGEKEQAFLDRAPKLRKRDVEEINALFDSYIFRREGTGEVWSTCCRRYAKLPPHAAIWTEKHVREPRNSWDTKQAAKKNRTPCPFCGRPGTVKDIRYTGSRKNLWQWRRFLLLRWDGKALWAMAGEAIKDYGAIGNLDGPPRVKPADTYRFGSGAVELVPFGYYGPGHYQTRRYADFGNRTVDEPFRFCFEYGLGYAVLGTDALRKSPVHWCEAETYFRGHDEAVKFLHLAHVYPRQVEMLMKAGMAGVVHDLAKRGVKHCRAIDWSAEDPRRAFKATPQEVKDFLRVTAPPRDIGVLETFLEQKRKGERISMEDAETLHTFRRTNSLRYAKIYKVPALRLWRYLERQDAGDANRLAHVWEDYIRLAEQLGRPLYRSDSLLPKDVTAAHEQAVKEYNARQKERLRREKAEREKREVEAIRAAQQEYEARREALERKYAWASGGYVIRVPKNGDEIKREGIDLQHCVGGYAKRHLEGQTVILFLRKEKAPDTPFLTIEMWDRELHQIHGYRNEGQYSAGGRFAPDPRTVYAWFLDPWLAWIAGGSRRKKDGTPIAPEHKEEKTA